MLNLRNPFKDKVSLCDIFLQKCPDKLLHGSFCSFHVFFVQTKSLPYFLISTVPSKTSELMRPLSVWITSTILRSRGEWLENININSRQNRVTNFTWCSEWIPISSFFTWFFTSSPESACKLKQYFFYKLHHRNLSNDLKFFPISSPVNQLRKKVRNHCLGFNINSIDYFESNPKTENGWIFTIVW